MTYIMVDVETDGPIPGDYSGKNGVAASIDVQPQDKHAMKLAASPFRLRPRFDSRLC